jgi:hypothetical protein
MRVRGKGVMAKIGEGIWMGAHVAVNIVPVSRRVSQSLSDACGLIRSLHQNWPDRQIIRKGLGHQLHTGFGIQGRGKKNEAAIRTGDGVSRKGQTPGLHKCKK